MRPTLISLKAVAPSQPFKRSQQGLFQGKTKQYGNNVPFSKHKTRRSWLPNVQSKRLFSDALGNFVRINVTTRALKTIHKHGSLDNYLTIGMTPKDLSPEGMRLRILVQDAMRKPKIDLSAPEIERKRDQAVRQENRVLKLQLPTLEDAVKVRKEAMRKLGIVYPNPEAEDPWHGYQKNTKVIADYVQQQASSRRALARSARTLKAQKETKAAAQVALALEIEATSLESGSRSDDIIPPPSAASPSFEASA